MCRCETGKNIAGGWAFIPCTCEEAEYKKQNYKNVILPRRMKQIAEMEARLNENGRAAHA